ncbi:histidine phosphatase superfamily (branch 1) domain-containing protein [Ditylenchus destructor]|uniref:Histidine phosphatase superfamily (Branch 1) domain-containing protein n=1 Tax=Ditylenchus destructor TaxID=166010 RepID=A0AAD4MWC3_9BILA|nr:histidine phosphatase superfamily (branch 1) domain-containing protein [Ditylenchus destructor]
MGRCVWVVRHGERIDNVDLNWAKTAPRGAWDDPPITARGLKQAHETGIALARDHDQIHHIFSSPMFRCLQTVNVIVDELKKASKGHKVPRIYIEPGFVESLNMCQTPPGYLPIEELV